MGRNPGGAPGPSGTELKKAMFVGGSCKFPRNSETFLLKTILEYYPLFPFH